MVLAILHVEHVVGLHGMLVYHVLMRIIEREKIADVKVNNIFLNIHVFPYKNVIFMITLFYLFVYTYILKIRWIYRYR